MKPQSKLTRSQKQDYRKTYRSGGDDYSIKLQIRYDDECKNGHNTFAMTADIYQNRKWYSGGCQHEEIAKRFPEFAKYIKWHLTSSDEPMHYIANTMYLANDVDCSGYRKGEYSAFKKRVKSIVRLDGEGTVIYTTDMMYRNKQNNSNLAKSNEKEEVKLKEFTDALAVPYTVEADDEKWSVSEGKESELESARNTAIWPDATKEQLLDKKLLLSRIPQLMQDFHDDMVELGFEY